MREEEQAKEVLRIQGNALKQKLADYNPYEDNYQVYLEQIGDIDIIIRAIEKKLKKLRDEDKKEAENILSSAKKLRREILIKFDQLTSNKRKRKRKTPNEDSATEVAQSLSRYTAQEITIKLESLLDMVDSLDIEYNEEMKKLIELIDESLVQALATSKSNYYHILNQLKDDFEND